MLHPAGLAALARTAARAVRAVRLSAGHAPVRPQPRVLCKYSDARVQPSRITPEGRAEDVKVYTEPAPPMMLSDLRTTGRLATIGTTQLDIVVRPSGITLPKGGFIVVLEASGGDAFPCDLYRLDPGVRLDCTGILRALVFSAEDRRRIRRPRRGQPSPHPPSSRTKTRRRGACRSIPETARIGRQGRNRQRENRRPRAPRLTLLARSPPLSLGLHGYRLGYVEPMKDFSWMTAATVRSESASGKCWQRQR